MLVTTKNVDALLKGVVSPDKLMISRIEAITKSLQLDPNISSPKKEMFIISNDDLKNAKVRRECLDAVKVKHPECVILYINKIGREYPDVDPNIFDAYLLKPTRDDIITKFSEIAQSLEDKAKLDSDDIMGSVDPVQIVDSSPRQVNQIDEDVVEEPVVSLNYVSPTVEVKQDENGTLSILDRIKQSENWAALTSIAQEVSASRVVQEIAESNASFRQSETYVTALTENITAILANREYDTQTQLAKVRAILHDKAYIKAKNNSIVEQCVEQIITALVDKAKEEVLAKTTELDERIIYAMQKRGVEEAPNVRLSTIIENRAKLLIELTSLDVELKGIASACLNTVNGTVDSVISGSVSTTGSPILDSQMKARNGNIVPENLITVLDNLFQTGSTSSDEFGKLSEAVNSTVRKLYALLSYYQEESEVLADTIKYLRANNVEGTVVANTIMKKTSRLFIHNGDFDSVALSYIIAKHNSRKNNNVLLLDLSGSNVIPMFGLQSMKYSDFMEHENMDKKLLIVSTYNDAGVSISTPEDMQRLSTRLLQYAKHYSMINIMCTPEQEVAIESFKNDVLSTTYLVDCYPTSIKSMAKCIESSNVDNTANRVVLVNYVSDSSKICSELNVMGRLDMQLAMCKPIQSIRYCSLHEQDPYDVDSIVDDCGGVLSIC